ncbi:MAG: response regulator transcription factor [Chloroflexota bacterium]|nr:response regulator transcription factor [Chloroflexota bacterium]
MTEYIADFHAPPPPGPIRILLVDDHLLLLQGLAEVLQHHDDLAVVDLIVGGAAAVIAVDQLQPDVIVMDIQMPDVDGLEATRRIVQRHPQARILILSSSSTAADVRNAFAAGVCGYLLKSTSTTQLLTAIHQVMAGEPAIDPVVQRVMMQQLQPPDAPAARPPISTSGLTEREAAVMQLIATGHSNKEIGGQLSLAENTVKHHVSNILQKLGLADRTQLAIHAHQHGLV